MIPVEDIIAAAVEGIETAVHDMSKATYPDDHKAGMRVPKGGSSCASCEYLADNKTDCTNTYFQKWNGGPKIPAPIDSYCSDWYEHDEDMEAAGTTEGAIKGWDTRGRKQKILDTPPTKPIPLGKTTEDVFRDSKTGEWEKKREEWHQAFADKAIVGKTPAIGRLPIAVVLGGGTASGKSTLARKLGADDPNMVHVDADGIKPQIPEHGDLRKQETGENETFSRNPNLAASRVHEESSYLAKLILAKAAANHLDVIYDATSSGKGGGTLAGIVTKLHNEGYDIHGLWADVPIEIARVRAQERASDPTDPAGFGRHIPEEAMMSTHTGAAANFMLMKDSPMFTSMKLYDTSGGLKDAPKVIYSREANKEGVVYDDSKWSYYRNKAAAAL